MEIKSVFAWLVKFLKLKLFRISSREKLNIPGLMPGMFKGNELYCFNSLIVW